MNWVIPEPKHAKNGRWVSMQRQWPGHKQLVEVRVRDEGTCLAIAHTYVRHDGTRWMSAWGFGEGDPGHIRYNKCDYDEDQVTSWRPLLDPKGKPFFVVDYANRFRYWSRKPVIPVARPYPSKRAMARRARDAKKGGSYTLPSGAVRVPITEVEIYSCPFIKYSDLRR